MRVKGGTLAAVLLGALAAAPRAEATPITLSDANSTFWVEPTSQQGAFSWQVDGTEQLFQEWFWYRAFPVNRERSIDQQSTGASAFVSAVASDNDADPGNDRLVVTYNHPSQFFSVEVQYDLAGGASGSGLSTVSETVRITNTRAPGGANLTMNLFEYSNFNVNGTAGDDTATRTTPSQITQTDPVSPGTVSVTSNQPVPDRYEIAPVPVILNKLNDSGSTTLANSSATATPPVGPADVAFAFQWTQIITPGSTWIIQKDKNIAGLMAPVPEPATLLLVGTGLVGLYQRRRKLTKGRAHAFDTSVFKN